MTEEINGCPGCHETDNIQVMFTVQGQDYYVHCNNCGATGPHAGTEDQAVHRWNQMCGEIRSVVLPPKMPRTNE